MLRILDADRAVLDFAKAHARLAVRADVLEVVLEVAVQDAGTVAVADAQLLALGSAVEAVGFTARMIVRELVLIVVLAAVWMLAKEAVKDQ